MRVAGLIVVLMGLFAPLPGVPTLPEGSVVQVMREDLQSRLASGTVRGNVLALTPLPGNERVQVWIGVPGSPQPDIKAFPGQVASGGADIRLDHARGTSLKQLLLEAYRVRLEIRQ